MYNFQSLARWSGDRLEIQQMLISHNVSFDDGSVFSIRARRLQIDSIYCVHNHPPLAIVVLQEGEKKESSDRIHQSNSFKVLD